MNQKDNMEMDEMSLEELELMNQEESYQQAIRVLDSIDCMVVSEQYLQQTFSREERKYIVQSQIKNDNNVHYGTEGGKDTRDYLYLLSINEAKTYLPMLPSVKINCWLRSPGNNSSSAAFYTANDIVMDYGYDTTDKDILVRPVLTVSF